jgi:hypothetical protein
MPLTEAEKIEVRTVLRFRANDAIQRIVSGKTVATLLDECLTALGTDALAAVRAILTEFASIKYESGELHGTYEQDPVRQRQLLRDHLITVLDFNPDAYRSPSPGQAPGQALQRGS